MMGTEIFNIDASWTEKLMKRRVSFLTAPTVVHPSVTYRSSVHTVYGHEPHCLNSVHVLALGWLPVLCVLFCVLCELQGVRISKIFSDWRVVD